MLDGGGDNVPSPLAQPPGGAENGPVVRFGAPGGEEHPVRLRSQGGGHSVPSLSQLPGGVNAEAVESRGVAPVLRHGLCHRRHSLLAGLGGGGIIQINHILSLLSHAEPLENPGGDILPDGSAGDFAHGRHGFLHIG